MPTGLAPPFRGAGERIRDVVRRLPAAPGVYRFRDDHGHVQYVGRATDLRARVGSYWTNLGDRPHLAAMVARTRAIEAVPCDSVHEAAWLERNLLEAALPRWNVTPGGQEVPVHVVLDDRPGSPGVRVCHLPASGPARTFGPYLGGRRVRLGVAALHRVLPLAYAGSRLAGADRDMAARRGVGPADRERLAAQLADVLDRRPDAVAAARARLTRARDAASHEQAYELAARIHTEIDALDWLTCPQRVTTLDDGDADVHGWADGVLVSFAIRGGRLRGWTQRRRGHATAEPLTAATPAAWQPFALRAATLAAALRAAAPPTAQPAPAPPTAQPAPARRGG